MQIIGVDLHTRQQTIAMLDTETGELVEETLQHVGEEVRDSYSALTGPVQVGLEASGSMYWFLELMEELGIDYRVGHPSEIRKAEIRQQKHDRRDAALLLKLQVEKRFPSIWLPSSEPVSHCRLHCPDSGFYICSSIDGAAQALACG